jgi:hypothetical protein
MSVGYNPKIVTSGLVLCLDAASRKSYPGSGNSYYNLVGTGVAATATTLSITSDGSSGNVANLNSSTSINYTFPSVVDKNSWSLIYWVKSTGLTSSDYRNVLALIEPNASHNYYYNVDTRQTINSYILGYQKDFLVNDWLTAAHMTDAEFATQKWWCLGVSHNNLVFNHYTNGILLNTQTQTRNVAGYGNLTAVSLNRSGGNTVLLGAVQVYNRTLTSNEFQQNFNALRGRVGI